MVQTGHVKDMRYVLVCIECYSKSLFIQYIFYFTVTSACLCRIVAVQITLHSIRDIIFPIQESDRSERNYCCF
jgi:hypothetical protein